MLLACLALQGRLIANQLDFCFCLANEFTILLAKPADADQEASRKRIGERLKVFCAMALKAKEQNSKDVQEAERHVSRDPS